MVKTVTQKEYDEFKAKVDEQKEKMEKKVYRVSKSGELVRRALFSEITTKWDSEWEYIKNNVTDLYSECFSVEIAENGKEKSSLDTESKDELIKEIFELDEDAEVGFKLNKLFWGMMSEAQYLKMKSEFEEMTVEEENSSQSSSSPIEDYQDTTDCSDDDIKDLKSNKGK